MALIALLVGFLLWYTLDLGKLLRNRQHWKRLGPVLAAGLIGLLLIAKGALLPGGALIAVATLWTRWPRRRRRAIAAGTTSQADVGTSARNTPDYAEACDLLGVAPDADRETILSAHRRLIARNHPDSGGSATLAARLNAARDVLLQ